jgi:hypothetical protein
LVDRDLQISPVLREGFRISGAVEFDGSPPTAKELERWSLDLEPVDHPGVNWDAQTSRGNAFSTSQLAPGRYYLRPEFPKRFLKSVTSASGSDLTGAPINVVDRDIGGLTVRFSEQAARVQGTVAAAPGRDVPRIWVAVFPVERDLWATAEEKPLRFARILTGTDGTYDATLPPGRYYLIAVDRRVRWADDWAGLAARAEVIELREGTLTRDLTITSVR